LRHVKRSWRKATVDEGLPHAREGRWAHVAFSAGGTHIHVFNVYGWPEGTQDRAARQDALWAEVFGHIAGLGGAPWIAGGDWNATPGDLWPHALNPRVGGVLAGPAAREVTCYPVRGEPKEYDFFLVSRSLSHCVAGYKWGAPGTFPVHKAVTLTLHLDGMNRPIPTLLKPRAIPEPERPEGQPPAECGGRVGPEVARPWGEPMTLAETAQASWDIWTRRAEEYLLQGSGVDRAEWGPYRGRGEAARVQKRRPCPSFTTVHGGEEHGRARAWTIRADRCRDLARA